MRRLSALSLAIGAAFSMAAATPATADFKVEMPDAETGEFAVEPIGDIGQDPLAAHSSEASGRSPVRVWRQQLLAHRARVGAGTPAWAGPVDPL